MQNHLQRKEWERSAKGKAAVAEDEDGLNILDETIFFEMLLVSATEASGTFQSDLLKERTTQS